MCSEDSLPKMNRRDFLKLGGVGLAGAVLLGTRTGGVLAQTDNSLIPEIDSAAQEYGVPKKLLLAMGYVNTLWEMPPPEVSEFEPGDLHGHGGYGIMQLYQRPSMDTLGRAAELTGLSEEELKNNRAANIRGGAAVLADIKGKDKPLDLDGWQEAVAEYGDIDLYAEEVFSILESGTSLDISTGEDVKLTQQDVSLSQEYSTQGHRRGHNTDYPRAVWRPAYGGNYTRSSREKSYNINRIVVHVAQGSYPGTIRWFKDPRANVSAHYVVSRKGRVAQCVRNRHIAWHAGNWNYNTHSIGIEHAGYAGNRNTWSRAMIRSSARLAAYLCRRHKIPVDRKHIIGHRQVPGGTHSCPGRYFPFKKYLRLVRKYKRR